MNTQTNQQMLKLKEIKTKPVTYQGLVVDVPVDTNYMWLRHTNSKTVLWASAKKPVWNDAHNLYIPPSDAAPVAELEHADLTVEQVKASLETDENVPTAQDLEKLDVVNNLIKNLRSFADSLERNVAKATHNPSPEKIQALLEHVYADDGELDTFYNHAIHEATEYDIVDMQSEESEDYADLLKLINAMFK